MSVIAWDGKCLAADKQGTYGNVVYRTTKLSRVGDGLVGVVGDAATAMAMLNWIRTGEQEDKFPRQDKDATADMLYVRKVNGDVRVALYSGQPVPVILEDQPFFALGSGRDFALVAMYLRQPAVEAVRIAAHFDMYCGQGVDFLTFDNL